MHCEDVGASLRERLNVRIGRRNHEMDVEYPLRQRPDRLDDIGAKTDVRHEMPIHDVAMDPVGAGRVDRRDLLAEPGEVCRQDRRRNKDLFGHGLALLSAAEPSLKTRLARTSAGSIVSSSAISSMR